MYTLLLDHFMEKKYQIYERKNPSGNIGYRIHIGGKKFRQFRTKRDALIFIKELKDADIQKDKSFTRDLGELIKDKYILLNCREKLEKWGTTWEEVFGFYETFGEQSSDINITIEEGIDIVLESKKKDRYVSENYLKHLKSFSFKKFKNHFGGKYLVKNISRQKFEEYLRKFDLSISSKNHIIRSSKTFFNALVEKGHLPLNPIAKLSYIPLDSVEDYEILKISEVRKILTSSLNEEDYSMLAVMILVLYCGCRIGEVKKMKWHDIRYYDQSVRVSEIVSKKTKKLHGRTAPIPPNAMCWLRFCHKIYSENKTQPIVTYSSNYFNNRLSVSFKRAGLEKKFRNVLRHTFASYGANHLGLQTTAEIMGHYSGIKIIKDNYQHLTTITSSERYFDLYPYKKDLPTNLDEETLRLVEQDLGRKEKT